MSSAMKAWGAAALALAAALATLVWWQLRDDSGYSCPWPEPAQAQWLAGDQATPELVVLLHAYTADPSRMCQVAEWLRVNDSARPDVLVPRLPLDMFSRTAIESIVEDVAKQLQARWDARAKSAQGPYQRVRLVGHSMGSLIARRVYLQGLTSTQPAAWAAKTDRIVLLAGVNRGWSIDHHMSLLNGAIYQAGESLNDVLVNLGMDPFTVMAARHGSPFVNDLRLRWQELPTRWLERQAPGFRVVQLLGTVDDIVPPSDNVDAASSAGLVFLQAPQSGHTDVVRVLEDAVRPQAPALRAAVFARAWQQAPPEGDKLPLVLRRAKPDACVQHVVFVMHGIRDEGHWTERVAAAVEEALKPKTDPASPDCPSVAGVAPTRVAFEISSYGYFPMLSFLRPAARHEKVAWLLDRYAEARALYPKASFHYVGHSHGTYLLREAMRQVSGVHFDRVVLAGSVLRSAEPWQSFFDKGQVKQLLNLRASGDWVVAIFPNTMESIHWQDLGGAGFQGFKETPAGLTNGPLQDQKLAYVKGAHGTTVDEHAWRTIAHFVAQGELDQTGLRVVPDADGWVSQAAGCGLAIWGLILIALSLGLWGLVRWRAGQGWKVVAVLAYLNLVWLVVTRV